MPYIEEEDLIALHKKIEREQESNKKLLDQINSKNHSYDKNVKMRNTAWSITTILCLAIIGFAFYSYSALADMQISYASCYEKNLLLLKSADSTSILKDRLAQLENENENLRDDLDKAGAAPLPARILRDSVYTVQINAFETDKIPLRSNTNFIYTQNPNLFYAFCIGIFDTPDEARILKKQLIGMGFEDVFVALYKDGKRRKIIED